VTGQDVAPSPSSGEGRGGGDRLRRLEAVLDRLGPVAVAVSGGVDSMTLAHIAHRRLGGRATMYHAISPAVPPAATARVERHARAAGWRLEMVDAGEFADESYLANPANRCFFCKTNLYATLARLTGDQLLSGTNTDDLGDWRPGLKAAAAHAVRHPYVEAGIDKAGVRALATLLGLFDLAELPAAPCLSSRVETGIRIRADLLRLIDATETLVRERLAPETVRCRVRREGVVVELDEAAIARLDGTLQAELEAAIERLVEGRRTEGVTFAPYRRGSAFLREAADA
jgi:pyridinium-3,5-biscarboxylic acid mononucleotide sulfurtransferase